MAFFTGSEHAVATWLTLYGERVGGVEMATMALMVSVYWCTITLTRVSWVVISSQLASAWPVLFFDAAATVCGGLFFVAYSAVATHPSWILWVGTVCLGVGVATPYPVSQTLPEEA